ncbi:MAG: hypothetical protein N3A55_04860, partial [Methylohalobius sp.]|nr:hypothetical protein [Methylohalobius sp.]
MSFYLQNQAGVSAEVATSGTLRRLRFGELLVNLFLGSELEAGVTNLYLRRHEESTRWLPLLGPQSPSRIGSDESSVWLVGEWLGVHYTVHLGLAKSEPIWFWRVYLKNL